MDDQDVLLCVGTMCICMLLTFFNKTSYLYPPTSSPESHYEELLLEEYLSSGKTVFGGSGGWELVEGIPKYTERTERLHL